MEIREAQRIVKTLAQGIDPDTGEIFAPDSPYNQQKVIRALFTVHGFVRQARKPRMSADEKRQENLDLGRPGNYGLPWTDDARSQVAKGFEDEKTIGELASTLERTQGAIHAELIRQGLLSHDDHRF